ncbi:MAG: endonuclease/exonuclease/phosphatase family protein [Cytophagales bacterium]
MFRIRFFTISALFCFFLVGFAQKTIQITSWNLCNFGRSKSDLEIAFIAKTIQKTDILAIQEVSSSYYGAQAVAKLVDELNRTGSKWAYCISEPTVGNGSERFAYIWKTSKARLIGKAWLEKALDTLIDREPFLARFQMKSGEKMLLACLHAVPKAKEPWRECQYLYKIDSAYKADNLMIMGDFNLSESNKAFDSLKERKIVPAFRHLKTSIKMKIKNGEKFANEFDNLFIDRDLIKVKNAGRIDFTDRLQNLKEARKISDHVPVFAEIEF